MHTITIERYQPTDSRLGRYVYHDSRSLVYAALPKDAKPVGVNTMWDSGTGPLNQGSLGSCTGNSVAQWLNTNFANTTRKITHNGKYLTEADAVEIYSMGTSLDGFAGTYPPTDTGCNGVSVAKAGVKLGYLTSYSHTFSFTSFQATLEKTPVICGTVWTQSMFHPTNGLLKVGSITQASIAGGHEYLACGIDFTEGVIIFRNSWGDTKTWPGCKPGGYFAIKFADYQRLLAYQGDVTVLHGKGQN